MNHRLGKRPLIETAVHAGSFRPPYFAQDALSSARSTRDACQKLDISQARFFELRATMLKGAVESLQPKPVGRPVRQIRPETERIQQLEQQNLDLRVHLAAAQLREEIALAMPHLSTRHKAKKKGPKGSKITPASSYQITRPHSESSTPGSSDT